MPFFKSIVFWFRVAPVAAISLLAGCGGGAVSTSGGSTTPSYGGGLTPGSVAITVTNKVTLTTNYGVINIGLDATHAPLSTANFLAYVQRGAYTNTLFHRAVPNFVVQGGGYTDPNNTGVFQAITTSAAIALESRNGLSNVAGTLGMARTSDPGSATSQFYVNVVNNATILDYPAGDDAGYAVFGMVMDAPSLAVAVTISQLPTFTNNAGMSNVPVQDVIILSAVQTQ